MAEQTIQAPNHQTPGTKGAGDKARHLALSLLCSVAGAILWVIEQNTAIDRCFTVLLLPLGIGVVWGLIPFWQDWSISLHFSRHSWVYVVAHSPQVDITEEEAEPQPARARQAITLIKPSREEELEAANMALLRRLAALQAAMNRAQIDQTTEHLN